MLQFSKGLLASVLVSTSCSLVALAAPTATAPTAPAATVTPAPSAAPAPTAAVPTAAVPTAPAVSKAASPAPTTPNATAAPKAPPQAMQVPGTKPAAVSTTTPAHPSPFVNNHYVLTASLPVNGYHASDPTLVIVDKGSHSTYILQLQNNTVTRVLTVSNAIGTEEKPTPPGRYSVLYKKQFPTWIPPKTIDKKQKPVPPYNETHKNPLGVAALFLNKYELALHGTNDPGEIRQSASHGCVRHSNSDISKIYGMVHKGDTVIIIREFRGTVLNKADFKPRHGKTA